MSQDLTKDQVKSYFTTIKVEEALAEAITNLLIKEDMNTRDKIFYAFFEDKEMKEKYNVDKAITDGKLINLKKLLQSEERKTTMYVFKHSLKQHNRSYTHSNNLKGLMYLNTYAKPIDILNLKQIFFTPFVGRSNEVTKIIGTIVNRYKVADSSLKSDQNIVVVAGPPGIGKSRLLQELPRYLDAVDESCLPKSKVNISITLGNGSPLQHQSETPQSAIATRMLHHYFASGHGVGFPFFVENLSKIIPLGDVTPNLALSIIINHCRKTIGNQDLMITISLDEFQKALTEVGDDSARRLFLKHMILELVGLCLEMINVKDPTNGQLIDKTFVFPLTAGTILDPIDQIISRDSALPYTHVSLPLLSKRESHSILADFISKSNLAGQTIPTSLILALDSTGGWPRPIELMPFIFIFAYSLSFCTTGIVDLANYIIDTPSPEHWEHFVAKYDLVRCQCYSILGIQPSIGEFYRNAYFSHFDMQFCQMNCLNAPQRFPENSSQDQKTVIKGLLETGSVLSNPSGSHCDFILRRQIKIGNDWRWTWIFGDAKFTRQNKTLDFNADVLPSIGKGFFNQTDLDGIDDWIVLFPTNRKLTKGIEEITNGQYGKVIIVADGFLDYISKPFRFFLESPSLEQA
ncbi:hypothetical protein DFA_01326 [Cavenderia fasciculata]|uniref:Uncharacterized protein n=1 Tax=Cavenderia fasciculata TaxID=261658 RepID=F4PS59_CACFS|nr:uncharacterized protein DFA_01326 [Cavenderia fasciculata]EGG21442.1 hypothetical protein DFA_01326 [Cavenderia fasciculata]|eukprot:XP_004359292.1 hypothetical protein DFA_01326 [Cavenderia fasciculata]